MLRKIIHIDMDAFYTSVEQRNNPKLIGKPIAVGGTGRRGIISAASYEARKFGVRSGMPGFQALKLCPQLILLNGNYLAYKEVSIQVFDILGQFSDKIETIALDEAYIDVTYNKDYLTAKDIAIEIKRLIKAKTNLTASAGVSFKKFLAKIASDYKKPDGLFLITPNIASKFINQLDLAKVPGIGKVTLNKLHNLFIYNGYDLLSKEDDFLRQFIGNMGIYFKEMLQLKYEDDIHSNRDAKSYSKERTLDIDTDKHEIHLNALEYIADKVSKGLEKRNLKGKTITLKLKYSDFTSQTRSKTFKDFINYTDIYHNIIELYQTPKPPVNKVRLLGIAISNFEDPVEQEGIQLKIPFIYNIVVEK